VISNHDVLRPNHGVPFVLQGHALKLDACEQGATKSIDPQGAIQISVGLPNHHTTDPFLERGRLGYRCQDDRKHDHECDEDAE
jgi:hypothetical protein